MEGKKTVGLEPDIWKQVEARAEAEGLTPDQVANEALQIGLQEGRWRQLISKGRIYGRQSGHTKDDVESLIDSFRNETRRR